MTSCAEVTNVTSGTSVTSGETFKTTTFTTASNGEFEEPAFTEDDIIAEVMPIPVPNGTKAEFTDENYTVFYTDITKGDSRLTEIIAYDLKTGEKIDVFAAQTNLAVKPGDEYFSGQQFLTKNFRLDPDGWIYLYMLTDYDTDGFHKRLTYRKNLKTLKIEEQGFELSDTPYAEYTSENGAAEILLPTGVRSIELSIPAPETGENIVIENTADWEKFFGDTLPEEGITLMETFGQYICYRYEYTEAGAKYNFIVSGIGYVDILNMVKYTVNEVRSRDPKSYADPMETVLESNLPSLIPDGFVIYDNELYYYTYRDWSDENWAAWFGDLPADNGWHMRNMYVYSFDNVTNNFGMWQDSDLPLPLPPVFTDPPFKIFDSPAAGYDEYFYDGEYVYYKNAEEGGNLYKKIPNSDGAGIKLADANVAGLLYSISVYGDEVFYVTNYYDPETATGTDGGGGTAYAVKKDGSSTEPRKVLEGIGDYFYVYDGVIYYTGGIESLNEAQLLSVPLEGGETVKIADFAMDIVIVNDQITYFNGETVVIYDIE
jgi:hypothetical protein